MSRNAPSEYVDALGRRGFVIEEWIGGGAYGNVYRADHTSLRRPVAIKFFDKALTRDETNRQRFMREAPLLARVQHPAIPYVITTGQVSLKNKSSIPYSVMQYVSGSSLDKVIASGKMDLRSVYRVMSNVLSALDRAHQHDVIHRDVKPDNIVVSDDGAYLIDFSIGICLTPEPGLTRATNTGERVGTIDYAAPEQMVDASSVDHRVDIYGAAVVLAEMLGARPRLKLDKLDVEIAHVPLELRALVRKAAADNPADRFQRAADFLLALERLVGPGIVDAPPSQFVLCPNAKCRTGIWSGGTVKYYWGPALVGPTPERFCRSCGFEYLRGCPKCRRALPSDVESLVAKRSKRDPDALDAYCAHCGELIFRTPTCGRCGSYLTAKDVGTDTATFGCAKCQRPSPPPYAGRGSGQPKEDAPLADEDIPF